MKLSAYHKNRGDDVTLLLSYDNISQYDLVYISKVFTNTVVPDNVLTMPNVKYGGTGFFYDKAEPLDEEIEHTMPDYHLYDEFVQGQLNNGVKRSEMRYYLDYSIGYLTRGCFRGCKFCVNRNCKSSRKASPLCEFLDESRPKICFLDDNFFSYSNWKELIAPVVESGKRFQFKQGLDERLLTEDKIIAMSKWKYDNEVIFAFDNIEDRNLIISKLQLIKKVAPEWNRILKFYVFCGWDKNDIYDKAFWRQDIKNMFERIMVLKSYAALPYIMRYEKVYESDYSTFYSTVGAWCNQPAMFKRLSFEEFAKRRGLTQSAYSKYKCNTDAYLNDGGNKGRSWREMERIANEFPEIAERYFRVDTKSDLSQWSKAI